MNAHWIVCFKLRNRQDLDGLLSELTAIYPYDVLLAMYEEAVNDQPFSFLFIDMKAPKEKMFSVRFEENLLPQGKEEDDGGAPVPTSGQTAGRPAAFR